MSQANTVASRVSVVPAVDSAVLAVPALICLAATKLLLHFAFSGRYGFFRDELYYMACGEHLAWGYVDQPPLVAVVARLSRWLLGDRLFAIRFFPALAGAFLILLTGWIARELGGGRFAQSLAALALLVAPAYLAFDSFLSMNAFEPVFWMLCALLTIRIVKGADQRLWLLVGLLAGVGLLNKNSMLVFGFALLAGLLLTPARSLLRSRWIWLGGLIAAVIFLPNLVWQWHHHWPQIESVRNAQEYKNVPVTPWGFFGEQILFMQPLTFPVWLAGLWFYFTRPGKPFRFLGWAYIVVLATFIILKGKTYYLLPAYPMLLAAGGVAFERFAQPPRSWLKAPLPAALVAGGIVTLPFGLPVLPVDTFLRYENVLPLGRFAQTERDATGQLPQLYADMFGWQEMVATVARIYHRLPPGEQTRCAILTENYGESGAIDYFGGAYRLPKAISGHNNYWLWGPRDYSGEIVIAIGLPLEQLQQMFGEIDRVATIVNSYAMPVENNLPVYVCRKPRAPLLEMWPLVRYYI